jgi:hypothetical protein
MTSTGAVAPLPPTRSAGHMQCRAQTWAGLMIGLVALAAPLARAAERPMLSPVVLIVPEPLARAAERLIPDPVVPKFAAPLVRAAGRLMPGSPILAAPSAREAERPMRRPVAPTFAASLARDAKRLDPGQLDAVTAGASTASAFAQAMASGPRPRTTTSTRTFARAARLLSVSLRRFGSDLVLAESVGNREVQMAFATAYARARGGSSTARCSTKVQFSEPTTLRLVEQGRSIQTQRASCLCTEFGLSVLPN